ncbi:MAG: hypothetical protein F4X72_04755 [Dehalococcoidia bacterium]|nr:hypothetical protein [Dehalococcoidia bacterium]
MNFGGSSGTAVGAGAAAGAGAGAAAGGGACAGAGAGAAVVSSSSSALPQPMRASAKRPTAIKKSDRTLRKSFLNTCLPPPALRVIRILGSISGQRLRGSSRSIVLLSRRFDTIRRQLNNAF